jgi:hypothetical protein
MARAEFEHATYTRKHNVENMGILNDLRRFQTHDRTVLTKQHHTRHSPRGCASLLLTSSTFQNYNTDLELAILDYA